MMLSKADLKALTGYTRASAQASWLRRHGWKFAVNALSDPVVAVAEFERHMVGGKKTGAISQEPDFSAINEVTRNRPGGRAGGAPAIQGKECT